MKKKGLRGFILLLVLLSSACHSPDDSPNDPGPRTTVPPEIKPSEAVFYTANRLPGNQFALIIHLSTANLCEKSTVPKGTTFITVEVAVAVGPIPPGEYSVGNESVGKIRSSTTASPGCSSSSGSGALNGKITLTEVSDARVVGSYEGAGHSLALNGDFIAHRCPNEETACL